MNKQEKKELRQQIACQWLSENYLQHDRLRHDIITDRLQVRIADSLEKNKATPLSTSATPSASALWRNLTDKDINTMVCNCVEETEVNVSVNEMWTALKSDRIPAVHPLREWIQSLRPYSGQTDWIDFVAQQVRVTHSPAGCSTAVPGERPMGCSTAAPVERPAGCSTILYSEHRERTDHYSEASSSEQSERTTSDCLWRICFKKWFVAMVASWLKDEVVNHTVLVLVGSQGIFKTTWLESLIPPALRAYSSKLPLSGQINKDDRLRLCENGMLNIDELDAICGREMNIVKSLLTSTDVNERAAYGRLKERRVRLASFCASTNKREFLTDITGNRRWLPFEVESIQNPFYTILPYEYMYAQALYLIEHDFNYWFDMEDINVLEQHNEQFRSQDNEEQLLPILFDIPAEGRGQFMTTAQISERLVSYGNIKKPMSVSQLGMLLGKAGYRAVQRSINGVRGRGWIVYQRNTDEINALKSILKDG